MVHGGVARTLVSPQRGEVGGGNRVDGILPHASSPVGPPPTWPPPLGGGPHPKHGVEVRRLGVEDARRIFPGNHLRVREQRFSSCDLTVSSMTGDIKNTTYFLYVARSFPLTCDFYITRLYNTATGRYVRIVVLTDAAWHRINGDMVRSDLAQAAQWLPQVVGVTFLGYDLVVADYEVWKQKVLQRQQVGGGMP